MELCDVCGSFLVIGDTQSRVDAHLLGKQHIGFARIRSTIEELKVRNDACQECGDYNFVRYLVVTCIESVFQSLLML
jgi:hypothetical protein